MEPASPARLEDDSCGHVKYATRGRQPLDLLPRDGDGHALRQPLRHHDKELRQVLRADRSAFRTDRPVEDRQGDLLLAPIARIVRVHEDATVEQEAVRAVPRRDPPDASSDRSAARAASIGT